MLDTDLELQQYFGTSNEFIKSLNQNCTTDSVNVGRRFPEEETLLLASCNYEIGTKWGKEVSEYFIIQAYYLMHLSSINNALLFSVYASRLASCMVLYVKMFTPDSY